VDCCYSLFFKNEIFRYFSLDFISKTKRKKMAKSKKQRRVEIRKKKEEKKIIIVVVIATILLSIFIYLLRTG